MRTSLPWVHGRARLPARRRFVLGSLTIGCPVDAFISCSAAKIFTDGALGSWGAAMHEPYSGAYRAARCFRESDF